MYPCLSRMALDYLSIPGSFPFSLQTPFETFSTSILVTSVDVERGFSRGRLLLTHVRRLGANWEPDFLVVRVDTRGQVGDPNTYQPLACIKVKKDDMTELSAISQIQQYVRILSQKEPHVVFRGILMIHIAIPLNVK